MKKIFTMLFLSLTVCLATFASPFSKGDTKLYVCTTKGQPVENYELVVNDKEVFKTDSKGYVLISSSVGKISKISGSLIGYSRIEFSGEELKVNGNKLSVYEYKELVSMAEDLFFQGKGEEILALLPLVSDFKKAKMYSSAFYCMYSVLNGNEDDAMKYSSDMYLLGVMPEKFGMIMADIINSHVVRDIEIDPDAGI